MSHTILDLNDAPPPPNPADVHESMPSDLDQSVPSQVHASVPLVAEKAEEAADTTISFVNQAKATVTGAYEAMSDKAASAIGDKKAEFADGLISVADKVHKVSKTMGAGDDQLGVAEYAARYTDTAAQKIEDAADYLDRKDLRSMARDVGSYGRRNPAIFLGAAFALGILAARFLKSSPEPLIESSKFETDIDHQLTNGPGEEDRVFGAAGGVM